MRERIAQALHGLSPEDMAAINTTTAKHILGSRLTIATAFVCLLGFINEVFDGGDRSYRMATAILDSWLFFLAAYLGINVAQYGIKRGTDKDTNVAVAEAKAKSTPPTVVAGSVGTVDASGNGPTTAERPAVQPTTAERPTVPAKPKTAPDLYTDDERGD